MIIFILGILTGLVLSCYVLVITIRLKTPMERTINQMQSKSAAKGSMIEPESEDLAEWVESLKTE